MKVLVTVLFFAGSLAVPLIKPRLPLGVNKIVGGETTTPGEFPYQVSFQDITWGSAYHICGGSVYDEYNIITAGHCVDRRNFNLDDPRNMQVVAGEFNLGFFEGHEQVKRVTKITLHEDYDSQTLANDIALLELGTPLTMNKYVQAIPLETSTASGNCQITGWGTLGEGGPAPGKLQKVSIPIVSDSECREAFGSQILDSMICAGGEGDKDSCQGDSGDPLNCSGRLAGIVSWGNGCARPGYPRVFTEVSHFVDWIHKHAK